MKIKTVPLGGVKAGPDDGLEEGEFIVYPSTFTRVPDAFGDVVRPGAFLDDIKAWKDSGDTLPGLYGHRMDDPDFFVAGAVDEGEDEHGWWVRGAFDLDSPKGPQVYRLVKGRRLRQLSFAYDVLDEGKVELEDGTTANELRKVKRHEFSFVPVGANQDTGVLAIKALSDVVSSDLKAGRVLSQKNLDCLTAAYGALGEVLSITDPKTSAPSGAEKTDEPSQADDPSVTDEAPTGKSPQATTSVPRRALAVARIAQLS